MFIQGITLSVTHKRNKDVCRAEDVVVTEFLIREQIQKLQRSVTALEHERDGHTAEHDALDTVEKRMAELNARFTVCLEQLKCSKHAYEEQYGTLQAETAEHEHKLNPVVEELRKLRLGRHYLEASHWLCRPEYPCLTHCDELVKTQALQYAEKARSILRRSRKRNAPTSTR